MAQSVQLPSESQFQAFATRLRAFHDTLPEDEQRMLDAMVHAAFKREGQADVEGYWWAAAHGPYGGVAVAGPDPAPGWYAAPVYYGTPWAYSYTVVYPYYP